MFNIITGKVKYYYTYTINNDYLKIKIFYKKKQQIIIIE